MSKIIVSGMVLKTLASKSGIHPMATFPKSLLLKLSVAAMTFIIPAAALASAFQILEQSPAHLGRAFAGTASNITDASAVFFNPAGMGQLDERQVTVGANLILVQSTFNDQGSNTGGIEDETDEPGAVPNLYVVQPINDRWTFGFGLNAPFGLESSYDRNWMGRYLATDSQLELVNLNATFAFKLTEQLFLGFGLNYQRADVTLESQVDSTLGINPNPATDSSALVEGDDDALAADVSLFFHPIDSTSVGLVWRQGGDFSLEGNATFALNNACSPGLGFPTGAPPAPTTGTLCAATLNARTGNIAADVELPDTLTLSVSQMLNDRWSLHGDIAWTGWSSIDSIIIVNSDNGTTVDTLGLMYDDTMRYALGASYNNAGPWTWRAGVAIDQAPQTSPALVSPRIPDEDRTWLSAGFNYAMSNAVSIDFGYAHLMVDDAEILNDHPQTGHRVAGNFKADVDIVGIQANWDF